MTRGFASLLVGAMLILLFIFSSGAMLFRSSSQDASLSALEVRRDYYRFVDANNSFSASINDALLDSAYRACGCAANAPGNINASVHSNVTHYFNNASVLLSDAITSANYSGLNISSVTIAACNSTYTYQFNYTLVVNSSIAKKALAIYDNRSIGIVKANEWTRINVTRGSEKLVDINVTCA